MFECYRYPDGETDETSDGNEKGESADGGDAAAEGN